MTTMEISSYSGDSSYKYIDKLLNGSGRDLMIISPYISNFYTKKLIDASSGKRVRIITSESSIGYKNSPLKNYLSYSVFGYLKIFLFLLIIGTISFYLQFVFITLVISALLCLVAILTYRKYKKTGNNMKVKVVTKKFIHEKLYINDYAIVGSANLTWNGTHNNIEHIEIIKEHEKIADLRDHFENLWSNN